MRHTSRLKRPSRPGLHGLSGNVSLSDRKEPISCAEEVYRDGGFPRRRVIARGNDGEEGIPFWPLRQMRTGRPW